MRGLIRAASALVCCGGLFSAASPEEARRDLLSEADERLLEALGDPLLSSEKRQTALRMLTQGGKEVIPLLIARRSDGRTFDPSYQDPSSPADGPKEKVTRTVGMACESILYRIIGAGGKSGPTIENWEDWWRENEPKSLPEIILEMSRRKK